MRRSVIIAASVIAFSFAAPAQAFHCPVDIKKIDSILAQAGPALPADIKEKAKALRDQGEKYHKAGDHGQSVKVLAEALKLLGQ